MHGSNIRIALASLGVIGLAASHQANAYIAPTATGNGELLLVAVDTSTGETFYQDLGITSLSPAIASFQKSVAADANYTKFVTDAGAHLVQYAVVGGGYTTNTNAAYDSTTGVTAKPTGPTNANVNSGTKLFDQNITGLLNGSNPSDTNPAVNSSYLVVPGSLTLPNTPAYTHAASLDNWNGKATFTTVQDVGTAQNFFNIASSSSAAFAHGTVTLLGSMNFVGGVLTYTAQGAPVPLPAAVWLLGSGLVGLMGIGRRRAAA